jgi:hypothetical protein
VGPAECLLNVCLTFSGESNPGSVVPDGAAHRAVVVECFVDDVPRPDLSGIVLSHGDNVVLQKGAEVRRTISVVRNSLRQPSSDLLVPYKAVSSNQHVVLLRKRDKLVGGRKVIGRCVCPRSRMDRTELHLIFRFELAKLPGKRRAVVRFPQMAGVGGSTDDEMLRAGGIPQRRLWRRKNCWLPRGGLSVAVVDCHPQKG